MGANFSPIMQAYQKYRKLCTNQNVILGGGEFTRTIAAAFARMPFADSLNFSDDFRMGEFWLPRLQKIPTEEDHKELIHFSLLPISWSTAATYSLGYPPTAATLINLPGSIHRAGGSSILSLRISANRLEDFLALGAPEGQDLEDLTNGIANIKSFNFQARTDDQSFHHPPGHSFFSALLNTDSLERLTIYTQEGGDDYREISPRLISFEAMVRPRPWAKMSSLNLQQVAFHVTELRHFLDCMPPTMDSISFDNVRLLGGTWAEVLDCKLFGSQTTSPF